MTFDRACAECFVIIVKASFRLNADGDAVAHEMPMPVTVADMFWGEPGTSAVKYESDIAYRKPAFDMIINATARAPDERPVSRLVVRCMTKSWQKQLLVTGDRTWQSGLTGAHPSSPAPFVRMPVTFDRAFGGVDQGAAAEGKRCAEERNLAGRGFCAVGRRQLDGVLLPNIEDPAHPMHRWSDQPAPVGLGIVGRAWLPRRSLAGTYDEQWKRERFPYLPGDFDERYFMSAPGDQWLTRYTPGERLAITNVSATETLVVGFPSFDMPVHARWENRRERLELVPDTALVEPDLDRLVLTSRVALPVGARQARLREVIVGPLSGGEERAFVAGKRYLNRTSTELEPEAE